MNDLFHLFNSNISIGQSLLYSVIGLAVVFLMLAILMVIIKIMAGVMNKLTKKPAPAAVAVQAETPKAPPAPGTAGELKLIGVSERDAAMIMAIVADTMGKPINELRFKSIREVKEDEV
jgi:sodium pump decarboxylase gamma subunit